MKRWLGPLALCVTAIFASVAANAAIVNVGGSNNGFSPQNITINVGDSITFINKGGLHNVVADNGSFRCARGCDGDGKGGSGSASSSNWLTTVTFNDAGTVGYFCETHGMPGAGMFGTITVQGATPPPTLPADPIPALGGNALVLLSAAVLLSALIVLFFARRRRRRS